MAMPPSGFKTLRDLIMFTVGTGILLYAIVIAPPPPEELSIGVGLTLIGIPATSLMGGKRGRSDS